MSIQDRPPTGQPGTLAGRAVLILAAWLATTATLAGGCIGGHFEPQRPAPQLDKPSQTVVEGLTRERAAKQLPRATWVADLRPAAMRAALAVARGELGLTTAAHAAAQGGVTALGRHVWSFAADCTGTQQFRPPAMAWGNPLLYALAAASTAPGPGAHTTVVLLIADPGTSALRADQMGGGRGGSNPVLETYVHPSVATGPCGESWPAAPSAGL